MTPFAGLIAFPITPTDANGHLDREGFARLLARLVAQLGQPPDQKSQPAGAIGVLGSTGVYAYLDRAGRRSAIEAAVQAIAGRCPVIAGIGALRTDDAIRYGRDARAAGADAVLLAPVSYAPLNETELFAHYEAVAAAVDLPMCLYDNPATTHVTFSDALLFRLGRLPSIVAVKTPAPSGEQVAQRLETLRAGLPDGFSVGYSVDWQAAEAMLAGAEAWYSVLGGLFPEPCLRITQAARAGDAVSLRRLDQELAPLWSLFREFSSLRVMYAAVEQLGLCRPVPPRPILPLPDAARTKVANVIQTLKLE